MVADGGSLHIQRARLRDGRLCDISVDAGQVTAMVECSSVQVQDPATMPPSTVPPAPMPMIDADGRLVTESFVNAYLHLDKVYTLSLVGEAALVAYTGGKMAAAARGIELARAVKADYDRTWITSNVTRALREAVRYGVLHILAFVDVDIPRLGSRFVRRPGGSCPVRRCPRRPGRRLPRTAFCGTPAPRPCASRPCRWVCTSSVEFCGSRTTSGTCPVTSSGRVGWRRPGTRVAMLVDDAGEASLRTSALLAGSMIEHGLSGRGAAPHARAVGRYPIEEQVQLARLAREAGLGFVSDPHTGPLALPVGRFRGSGVDLALGQDDIEDAYYPYGRHNMLEVAFLASHLLELKTSADQEYLLDLVTRSAARVIGLRGHLLAVGNPAL